MTYEEKVLELVRRLTEDESLVWSEHLPGRVTAETFRTRVGELLIELERGKFTDGALVLRIVRGVDTIIEQVPSAGLSSARVCDAVRCLWRTVRTRVRHADEAIDGLLLSLGEEGK